MRKIYFINPTIAKMILFIKPQRGKMHIKYWSRNTAYCGKQIEGKIIAEAAEDQFCARCLHSMRMNRDEYSYKEEIQNQGENQKQAQEHTADA